MAGTADIAWSTYNSIYIVQKKTYANSVAGTVHALTLDTTPVNGNFMLLFLSSDDNNITSVPSGWTLEVQEGGNVEQRIYSKYAGAGEPTNISFTIGATTSFAFSVIEFNNTTSSAAVDIKTGQIGQGGGTINTPTSGTTAQANELAIAVISASELVGSSNAIVLSLSNGFTKYLEIQTSQTSGVNVLLTLAIKVLTSTGTVSSTATMSDNGFGGNDCGSILTLKANF